MKKPPRSRLQVDERRAQLIALGARLFSQRPYEAVSIDEIAEQAGISRGLLYHYFGNKRAFYVACLREAAADLTRTIQARDDLDGPERLTHALGAYFDWTEARADAYLALMHGGMGRDPEVWDILEQTRDALVRRLLEGAGLEAPSPLFYAAGRAWLGAVEAAAEHWLAERVPERADLVAMLTEALTAMIDSAVQLHSRSREV